MVAAAIEACGLRKEFRVRERAPGLGAALRQLISPRTTLRVALDGLELRVEPGERVAFVGPNGAGKSTALKLFTGILHPSAGSVRVLGLDPWRARRVLGYRIGSVFGQRTQLFYHLPVADSFELLAHVYDQEPRAFRRQHAELCEAFGLAPLLATPVRQLSLGERMRCEIVASLLHRPEILFLDEPTIGLDVTAKATIRDLVREQSVRHGRTVLLTSHDTGDMERVCERVIVIHRGRLLIDGPIHALRSRFIRRKRITLETAEPSLRLELAGVRLTAHRPHRTTFEVDVDTTPIDAVVQVALARAALRDLLVEDPPMEEIVQAIYADAERGASA
jgi:ABC-2 type transport system ATP-binding protein